MWGNGPLQKLRPFRTKYPYIQHFFKDISNAMVEWGYKQSVQCVQFDLVGTGEHVYHMWVVAFDSGCKCMVTKRTDHI